MIPKFNAKGKREGERKTYNEAIKNAGNPKFEYAFIIAPRGELIPATKKSGENSLDANEELISRFYEDRNKKRFKFLHTHSYDKSVRYSRGIPSLSDLVWYIRNIRYLNSFIIAQRDKNTGEVQGYTFVHDKKREEEHSQDLDKGKQFWERFDRTHEFENAICKVDTDDSLKLEEKYKKAFKIAKEYGLDIRFHPERGYYFNKETGNYEKKPAHSLENIAASILIGFTILSLLVKVPFTGFVISDSIPANLGTRLFLIFGFLSSLIIYFILGKSIKKNSE